MSGEPCLNGHTARRYPSGECVECVRNRLQRAAADGRRKAALDRYYQNVLRPRREALKEETAYWSLLQMALSQ